MTVESLLAFNAALVAAIASPGPALLVAIQTTLGAGRRAGFAVGCGLGLMAAAWTLMALLGLQAVFELVPWAYTASKIAGAAYLLWVAWRMWAGARDPIPAKAGAGARFFRRGVWINLLNPKSVLFAAAVLVVIFPGDMGWLENGAVVVNHLAVELLFYALLAFGMSRRAVTRRYLRAKLWIDRTASVVLAGLGLRLLSDR